MTPGELPSLTSWPALIAYVAGLAYLVWHGWRQGRVVREVREQVSNSHSTNLREELDGRHGELMAMLSVLRSAVADVDLRTARIGDEVIRDRKDLDILRRDSYSAIRRLDGIAAKHHPEEG